jgi:hypothetical protein
VADDSVDIPIRLDGIEKALGQLVQLNKQGNDAVESITGAFKTLKTVALGALAGVTFKEIINSANESVQAIQGLNTALKLSGDYSAKTSKGFQDLALQIQKTANISDEQVMGLVSQAKAIGITNDQTKTLIKTSTDVAAVMGTDVNTAFSDLEKTLSGKVSRSLAQRFPELKRMSIEALASGDAIKLLGARYTGAAAEMNGTFSGAAKGIGLAFMDILEATGKVIVENPAVISGMRMVRDALYSIGDVIASNVDGAISLINTGLEKLAGFIGDFVVRNDGLIGSLMELGTTLYNVLAPIITTTVIPMFKGWFDVMWTISQMVRDVLKPVIEAVSQGLKVVGVGALEVIRRIQEFRGNAEAATELQKAIDGLVESTFKQTDAVEKNAGAVDVATVAVKTHINALLETEKAQSRLTNATVKASEERQKAIQAEIDKQNLAIREQQKGITSGAASNPAQFFTTTQDNLKKFAATEGVTPDQVAQAKSGAAVGAGLGLGANMLQGQAGAVTAVSGTIGMAADMILPGIGGVVGQIVQVMAQGPEASKAFVKGFIDALPTIIENIIESIPAIIDALVEAIPRLVERLITEIPGIAVKVGIHLAAQAPFIAMRMAAEFVKKIPEIIRGMVSGIVDAIVEALKSVVGMGKDGILGGGNSGIPVIGGIISTVGSFLGFADGGTVPGGAPYVDRVPTMLTPGEEILNNGLSDRLDKFLSQADGGSSGTTTEVINITVEGEKLATVMRTLKRRGYRTA